jgi:hypothetical protein
MFPWLMVMQSLMANKANEADTGEARANKLMQSYAKGAAKYGYPTEELDALAFNKQISDADKKSKDAFGGQMLAGLMGGGMFGGGDKAKPTGLSIPQQEAEAEYTASQPARDNRQWVSDLFDDLDDKAQAKAGPVGGLASRPYRPNY